MIKYGLQRKNIKSEQRRCGKAKKILKDFKVGIKLIRFKRMSYKS